PLDFYALPDPLPIPDFLDEEQQLLYRQAYVLYSRLFGFTNDNADFWSEAGDNLLPPAEEVRRGGLTYTAARGLYGLWDDFERAVLSVFTRESWDAKNTFDDNGTAAYINVDGRMYYFIFGRSGGNYNGNFPETFRLVERTDNTISFIMTAYYSNAYPLEGETYADVDARMAAGWEYSIDFPMRMVKTADGWRFDEFHRAETDGGEPFYSQRVPNPSAPAAPDPGLTDTPEPSPEPTPSTAPAACEHGLDNAAYGWSNGYLVFTCELDGATYPVPAVTQGSWEPGISEDFDGDGHIEHSFFQNGLMMIVDMNAGQLVTSTFDPNSTFAAFDQGSTWEMAEDRTVLTVSYLGRTVQVPLYISGGPSYPDAVIARPLLPEKVYPYTGYVFRGDHFDMSAPVDLGKVYTDSVSLSAHWSVRYTGGGFQVLSDSFQFELVPR
ncbi:MAG: hypothetical protein K2O11_02950, partial [Oscillospiraceae bacterium]|nr:hypothetical protein [Oscillospiraceae bacterium]